MQHENALASFENYLSQQSPEPTLQLLTPARGIALALAFYRDERVEGCALEDDADMLLFQWGIHGATAYLDITRQLLRDGSGEDEDIWQLSLLFEFHSAPGFTRPDSGNEWCSDLLALPHFEAFIHNSPLFQTFAEHTPLSVRLSYSCAG